jgi:hypothetical protein
VPLAALGAVAVAGALYLLGAIADGAAAAVVIAAAGLAAAAQLVRPALAARADPAGRALALAAAAGTLCLTVLPSFRTVAPGEPLAQGVLAARGDAMPLPAGLPSRVRLLVHVPLPQTGTPQVRFRLGGTTPPAEGQLERTYTYARVGRSGRSQVAHDRSDTYVSARLTPGAQALALEQLSGDAAGPLTVAVYPDRLPPLLLGALCAVALLIAAAAEARLRQGSVAAIAGMALAFGLLITGNATPASAVGTTLSSVLLGAVAGAAVGSAAAWIARRVLPAPALAAGRGARAA